MSSPYVYTPNPAYVPSGYVNTQTSPFIPSATLYPPSPYSNPTSLAGSPQIPALSLAPPGSPNTVQFPYDPAWNPNPNEYAFPVRQRRPSYHGDFIPPTSPFHPDGLRIDPDPYYRERRRSYGGGYYQPAGWGSSTFASAIPPPTSPAAFMLHPWLNADVWRGDLVLDLTSRDFRPLQINAAGQARLCPTEYLNQPATHPPITRLRVVSDFLPDWPIDIPYNPQYIGGLSLAPAVWSPGFGIDTTGTQPPITLADVLIAVHRSLHTRITQADFNRLSLTQERAVTRAYSKRCRATGPFETAERAEGVKRIDYLLDRKWFRGCLLDWDAGVFRLVVA